MRNLSKTIVIIPCLLAASMATYAQSTLEGKWHGTDNNLSNLPVIDLNIEQDASHVVGSVVFYVIKHNSDGSNLHVDGQAVGPMENLSYQPEKLSFDMRRSDGSVGSFRVELIDADHARFFRTSDHAPEGYGLTLVRVKP